MITIVVLVIISIMQITTITISMNIINTMIITLIMTFDLQCQWQS